VVKNGDLLGKEFCDVQKLRRHSRLGGPYSRFTVCFLTAKARSGSQHGGDGISKIV